MSTTLYQRAKTGKVKFIELWTESAFLCSTWGLEGGKTQTTKKECEEKNVGKANYLSAPEQAHAEMKAKIKKKMDQGYVEDLDDVLETSVVEITLDNLPKEFCPCKPISKAPKKILESNRVFGQRKRDGHCIILVRTETGVNKVYSRGMEDITEYLYDVAEIKKTLGHLPTGTMLLTEFVFVNKDGKDVPREIAKIVRKKDAAEVQVRCEAARRKGSLQIVPFDAMYLDRYFLGNESYIERFNRMDDWGIRAPEVFYNWYDRAEDAQAEGWEGFILRDNDDSAIHYSLNGKADKAGSYKYVFTQEDDFVVTGATKGKAGKHTGLYAQFNLSQVLPDGREVKVSNCGPGKLKHDRLAELTKEIDSGELTFPFVVQVEFRDRQPDSGRLEFPQLEEVRYDKKPEECVIDWIPANFLEK